MDEQQLHALGRSHFIDDLPLAAGTLHAAPLLATEAHARIEAIDSSAALALPGVVAVLGAGDIPGINSIGVVSDDEPLLADGEVCFAGQVVALVLAEDAATARQAVSLIQVDYQPLPRCLDARGAQAAGELFAAPRRFACGDVEQGFAACSHLVEGRVEVGGQEQLYLETQAALAIPRDDGSVLIHASSQSPSGTQAGVARITGLAMHQVEVDVRRLGGGFGGKESQASHWSALAALGALHCQRPVKLVLRRSEDLRATGKRHPYSADYRIGLSAEGRILAYQARLFQNAGAYTDLSLAVLERSLFHASGSYHIPHLQVDAYSCRTHLPPFTAMRGFGGPQAMFVLEAAIGHAARVSGIPASTIQRASLLAEGDHFPYGQMAERCRARACWDAASEGFGLARREAEIAAFNAASPLYKKGLAAMPIAFGISFTHLPLNQGSALLHAYADGSVGFSSGAVEMGQGVNRKLRKVVAEELGIGLELVRDESTNTTRVANVSPTAASVTADLNGKALALACASLRERLLGLAAERLTLPPQALQLREGAVWQGDTLCDLDWPRLLRLALDARISLSAQAHYSTPALDFDPAQEQGHPFAYHVYGTALTEVSLDLLRGTYRIERVQVVHDAGLSLDEVIDRGQVEGGVVQGLGWLTSEELRYDTKGRLLNSTLAGYKPPDIHAAPEVEVRFLPQADEPNGLLQAKAVGEPPLLYAIGGYSALMQALQAARPEVALPLDAPLTPERLLLALYG